MCRNSSRTRSVCVLPQLCVHQRVVVQDESLQVNQAPHLWRQAVQLVVTQVQIQQVCQVDEQLIGDGVNAIVAQIEDQHVPAVLQVPGDLCQLVVAEVLQEEVRTVCVCVLWLLRGPRLKMSYQHREVIQLEDVIRDSRILQVIGSSNHRLHT